MNDRLTAGACRGYLRRLTDYLDHNGEFTTDVLDHLRAVERAIDTAAESARVRYATAPATSRQMRVLQRYDYRTDLTKAQACQVLDALARNDWNPLPPELAEKLFANGGAQQEKASDE
jgi:hypothetical protein